MRHPKLAGLVREAAGPLRVSHYARRRGRCRLIVEPIDPLCSSEDIAVVAKIASGLLLPSLWCGVAGSIDAPEEGETSISDFNEMETQYKELVDRFGCLSVEENGEPDSHLIEFPDAASLVTRLPLILRYYAYCLVLAFRPEVAHEEVKSIFLKKSWFAPPPFDPRRWKRTMTVGLLFDKEHACLHVDIPNDKNWEDRLAACIGSARTGSR